MGLVNSLAQVLLFLKSITGSYGLAIILLTIMIRLALLPLTIKQTKSMKEMQKIQPEIKKIQAKHKNDKKKQQEEQVKLISEHGVNPLGGCLPMVLQLPIFFALFSVLRIRQAAELKGLAATMPALYKVGTALGGASFLGISSLGLSMEKIMGTGAATLALIPYGTLIVLMIGSQFFYSRAMASGDSQQNKMMNFMLIMMAYFAYIFPAGLLLYWITTNLVGILEHRLMAHIAKSPKTANEGASK